MADVNFKWHGPAVKLLVERELHRRLDAGAILVANQAKQLVSSAYPPASSPGEPPAKRTGHLRRSIAWEPDKFTRRIGTNVTYGKYLEQGTHTIAARPWLRPALLQTQQRIQSILGAPIV